MNRFLQGSKLLKHRKQSHVSVRSAEHVFKFRDGSHPTRYDLSEL